MAVFFIMEYFVYIIYSPKHDKYYKGFTTNPKARLQRHNEGFSRYTSNFRPWKLVYLEKCIDKKSALIRERKLKKFGKIQIQKLINSPKNILNIS